MKKLTGLVAVLAILVLGGYYGMGVATERTVRSNVDAINQTNGIFASIEHYNRGWFSSKASIDWRLHIPEHVVTTDSGASQVVPAQDYSMKMPLNIDHGPIIFNHGVPKFGLGFASTDLNMPAEYASQFDNFFTSDSSKPVLDLSLFVSYLNDSKVEMRVPAFKLIAKQGGEFEWNGMTSSTDVSPNSNRVEGDFSLDGMQFHKDDIKATFGKIESEYDLKKTEGGLYIGEASFTVPSIDVKNKDKTLFALQKFDLNSSSEIHDDLMSSHVNLSLAKIDVNNQTFGPGHLELSVKNLDATVLARINQQIKMAQQGTDAEKQKALFAILPDLPKLFSRGPEFEMSDLSFTLPRGKIEGNLLVSLPKGESANPFEMISKIQGKGKLKVPTEVVSFALTEANKQKIAAAQQTANTGAATDTASNDPAAMTSAQLSTMIQSGLIVQQGDYYVIEISLENAKVLVNGKPFNPDMLKVQ